MRIRSLKTSFPSYPLSLSLSLSLSRSLAGDDGCSLSLPRSLARSRPQLFGSAGAACASLCLHCVCRRLEIRIRVMHLDLVSPVLGLTSRPQLRGLSERFFAIP